LVSLIERRIRMEMQQRKIDKLPMRPAGMYAKKPTWRTVRDSFEGVHLATLVQSGNVVQAALKGMTQREPSHTIASWRLYARSFFVCSATMVAVTCAAARYANE
jgi:hypothetical protein